MEFRITAKDPGSRARTGEFSTPHGAVPTPAFMPVGTGGAVKAVHLQDLREVIRPGIVLANTYHLYLRPGMEVMRKAGGIHSFSSWNGPVLTDSGGYQVYSLARLMKVTDEGVSFRSHIDGSAHLFTPEKVVLLQRVIGADIMMAFDECPPYPSSYEKSREAMERTHVWLKRCVEEYARTGPLYGYEQVLFPIVQGGIYKDLRLRSAETVSSLNLPGNAIGGLSVGEPDELLYEMTDAVCSVLPQDKPRYLMGVGTPANLLEAIALGVDMFDCVMPTRNGRNGMLFTARGIINIRNSKWADDFSPVDPESDNFASNTYSRAFLHHLFKNNEILALQVATIHNLSFYSALMNEARLRIKEGKFASWKQTAIAGLTNRL